ncbi:hypothetical protein SAMN04487910_3598 [Aquimarina amphilecti]|uniref:Uncharacterized protein n=1 Tax=Aquimarina amphilecti TaxID=1038014 RepID=A0A1H7U6R1_AQUAM|nr:hypothetical protein [Aquimarina amphilecti]SEL92348.1 hypothetical protein SAMN04487910_3598 [Aquimarina amphilecti]
MKTTSNIGRLLILSIITLFYACSTDNETDDNDDNTIDPITCENSDSAIIYEEKDGLVAVEFESIKDNNDWVKENSTSGFLGTHYLVWKENQFLGAPGNGLLTYKIKISNPGVYRFIWRSRITNGTSGSEHNDSWLRFADASKFYGKKGESFVYPADTGQSPIPNGSSKDGWFKIYKSGAADQWKWQSSTSDNDAHDIFVEFDAPGTYTMEVSARSTFHALDRFVLFSENIDQNDAIDETTVLSEITCN